MPFRKLPILLATSLAGALPFLCGCCGSSCGVGTRGADTWNQRRRGGRDSAVLSESAGRVPQRAVAQAPSSVPAPSYAPSATPAWQETATVPAYAPYPAPTPYSAPNGYLAPTASSSVPIRASLVPAPATGYAHSGYSTPAPAPVTYYQGHGAPQTGSAMAPRTTGHGYGGAMQSRPPSAMAPMPGRSAYVIEAGSPEHFRSLIAQNRVPVIVDFYTITCGPCKRLAPRIEQLAREASGSVLVVKANVELSENFGDTYRVGQVPAVVLFTGGVERRRWVGLGNVPSNRDLIAMAMPGPVYTPSY